MNNNNNAMPKTINKGKFIPADQIINIDMEHLVMGYIRLYIEAEQQTIRQCTDDDEEPAEQREEAMIQPLNPEPLGMNIPHGIRYMLAKFYGLGFIFSSILTFNEMDVLSSMLTRERNLNSFSSLRLLYRGSRYSYNLKKFHELCDNIPNTITIIKTYYDHVFGGYSPHTWKSVNEIIRYAGDDSGRHNDQKQTFLFLLRSAQKKWPNYGNVIPKLPLIFDLNITDAIPNPIEIQNGPSLGPCFGFEDIHIFGKCDAHTYYKFGHANESFRGILTPDRNGKQHILSGGSKPTTDVGCISFRIQQIEVFALC